MEIRKTLMTDKGEVQFEGVLNQAEADLVIGVGLLTLLQTGAAPFVEDEEDGSISLQGSDSLQ